MKLAQLKQLQENATPATLQRSDEFAKIRELIGDKFATDIAVAWQGDARDFQRTGGKGFQSLVVQMLNDRVIERRYGVPVTPELHRLLQRLKSLAYHAFPDASSLRATNNASYANDVWGYHNWARECQEVEFDSALFEIIKADVRTLLTEDENRV